MRANAYENVQIEGCLKAYGVFSPYSAMTRGFLGISVQPSPPLGKKKRKISFFPLTLFRENPIRGTFHRTLKQTRSFVMKYIYQSEGAGNLGKGLIKRWVGCVLGLALFLSAAGSALADSAALTQQQYLQWMVSVCGERLPSSASGQDLINWARGKGMNPAGGWQLNAKVTKEVAAQTIVQLLNLAPRKGNVDAVRILEREGIILTSTDGLITIKDLVRTIDNGFLASANNNGNHYGWDNRDDDDGPRPTGTKPGYGHGDDNHVHTGPPRAGGGNNPGNGGNKNQNR